MLINFKTVNRTPKMITPDFNKLIYKNNLVIVIKNINSREYAVPEQRVVGGTPVVNNEFPFFAWISINGNLLCGATLISQEIILTSAHCFDQYDLKNVNKLIKVCAGTTELEDESKQICRNAETVIRHPFYDNYTMDNDIAVIRVDHAFPRTSTIQPIVVRTKDVVGSEKCITLGYGFTKRNGEDISKQLMYVKIPIVPSLVCALEYLLHNVKISSTMICAGYFLGGKDACYGDSGGPLICNNKLTGIVSFGISCAKWMRPGVYTNVSRFVPWIEKNTGLNLKNINSTSISNNSIWNKGNKELSNCLLIVFLFIFLYLIN